jgi:hypothetical protein
MKVWGTLCAVLLLGIAIGCGRPFDIKTPKGFVELEHQEPNYDYRATTADGVVVAVRAIDTDGKGDLDFWTHAVTLRIRDVGGYALLAVADVASADGTKGKTLRFGHDENGRAYGYAVTLFWTLSRLLTIEAGGTSEQMGRFSATLDWQVKTFRARCKSPLTPALASWTCNRW